MRNLGGPLKQRFHPKAKEEDARRLHAGKTAGGMLVHAGAIPHGKQRVDLFVAPSLKAQLRVLGVSSSLAVS